MRYNLKQAPWKLCSFDRNVPLHGRSMELDQTIQGNIPCEVPGGVAEDGNELMDDSIPDFGGREDFLPVTYGDKNISMLNNLVRELDPARMFSSPSGPNFYQSDVPGTSHDVHGEWVYLGNPRHYEYYNSCGNLFNSEVSCAGMSGLRTVRKILAPENQHPVPMRDNMVRRHHGDYWCCYDCSKEFFGEIADMKDYIDATQWMQAESLRYSLESNRRRAPRNSGSILWQLAEP